MEKIVFALPPLHTHSRHKPPVSIMSLASMLIGAGLQCEIVDVRNESRVQYWTREFRRGIAKQILRRIRQAAPAVVGLSCYSSDFNDVMFMAGQIKQWKGDVRVVVGGIHAILYPDDFLYENSPVDYAVVGEGEEIIVPFMRRLLDGKDARGIDGIAYFDTASRKPVILRTTIVRDLDTLPLPSYASVNMRYYTMPNPYAIRGIYLSSFHVFAGRGCPAQCTFCASNRLSKLAGSSGIFRIRSARSVVDEIERLRKDYGIDAFYFADDAFTLRRSAVLAICEELLRRNIRMFWACSTRINSVNEELIRMMRRSGCVQIDFGVESGSDRMLKLMKKGINVSQTRAAFGLCEKYGIRTFANILLNFPQETEDDLIATLKLLDAIKPTVTSFNVFVPYPGTDIYDTSVKHAFKKEDYDLLESSRDDLLRDGRFRFSSHAVNYRTFIDQNHRKYNHLMKTIWFHLSPPYLRTFLRSHRKWDYILNSGGLIKETTQQVSAAYY